MKTIDVAAAVIIHDHKVLLAKRRGGYLHNLWEFPGGKLETDESASIAAKRELVEELDINIRARETLLILEHQYPDKNVRLHFVHCFLEEEYAKCLAKTINNPEVDWFVPENFPVADFCPADKIAASKLPWNKLFSSEEMK